MGNFLLNGKICSTLCCISNKNKVIQIGQIAVEKVEIENTVNFSGEDVIQNSIIFNMSENSYIRDTTLDDTYLSIKLPIIWNVYIKNLFKFNQLKFSNKLELLKKFADNDYALLIELMPSNFKRNNGNIKDLKIDELTILFNKIGGIIEMPFITKYELQDQFEEIHKGHLTMAHANPELILHFGKRLFKAILNLMKDCMKL